MESQVRILLELSHKNFTFVFSIDVGQLILQQHYSNSTESLLNLETQHVLELGFARVFYSSHIT